MVVGRFWFIFDIINCYKVFDCNCDNFRVKIKFVNFVVNVYLMFFDMDDEDFDDLFFDFFDC